MGMRSWINSTTDIGRRALHGHHYRGANTETFSQTGQDANDELDRRLFCVEKRVMGLQKVAVARSAMELAPGTTTGMTVGAQIAQTEPPPVITTGMRTKVQRGVNLTGAPVRRGHGGWWYRR